jgi:hypothetical protein
MARHRDLDSKSIFVRSAGTTNKPFFYGCPKVVLDFGSTIKVHVAPTTLVVDVPRERGISD